VPPQATQSRSGRYHGIRGGVSPSTSASSLIRTQPRYRPLDRLRHHVCVTFDTVLSSTLSSEIAQHRSSRTFQDLLRQIIASTFDMSRLCAIRFA
jgi:hypothetical protein